MKRKSTGQFPKEFYNMFFQALLEPVIIKFQEEAQARSYRSYLYQYRTAYIREELSNYKMIQNIVVSIDNKGTHYLLTLDNREYKTPETPLLPNDELQTRLKEELGLSSELTMDEMIEESRKPRDKSQDSPSSSLNPYISSEESE